MGIKEPLRGIASYSRFLVEDYSDLIDEEGVKKLNTLVKLTKRMEDLIESLLYFSSLGRSDLKVGEVNPKNLVESVKESLEISLEQAQVDLRLPEEMPKVVCDFVRVEEVFRNLISNSIKYNDNDKEGKVIEVGSELYCHAKHGKSLLKGQPAPCEGSVVYFVRDNGIGVRERSRESVFKLFKRLHGRDKFGGGYGAGLPIVKKIVEQHGGIIWLESTFGEGTTFYFTLPLSPLSNTNLF